MCVKKEKKKRKKKKKPLFPRETTGAVDKREAKQNKKTMASSSSRLALRLCSSIRTSCGKQNSHAFAAAASVCGENAKAAAARAGAPSSSNSSSSAATAAAAADASSSSPKGQGSSSSSDGRPLAYVFLGAPGVGKGTYSTRVADALGAEHISAGDLVRAEVKKGSELGKQVRRASFFLGVPLPLF